MGAPFNNLVEDLLNTSKIILKLSYHFFGDGCTRHFSYEQAGREGGKSGYIYSPAAGAIADV
jgi:hypothetical protein